MQIELSDDLIQRATRLALGAEDAPAVFERALITLEWERQEVAAVQEGISAYERGDYEDWDSFSQRFMAEHDITPAGY